MAQGHPIRLVAGGLGKGQPGLELGVAGPGPRRAPGRPGRHRLADLGREPRVALGVVPAGRRAHARIRSPVGSQSGSAITSKPIHAPKTSISPRAADRRLVGRQVGIGDRALDGEAVAAARHPADDRAPDPDRLVAQADRARIVEDQAAQPLARPGGPGRDQGVPADELARRPVRPVEADGEAEAGFVGRLVGGDVARPDPVALLEAQGVDRPVAAGARGRARRRRPRSRPTGSPRTRWADRAPSRARRRRSPGGPGRARYRS